MSGEFTQFNKMSIVHNDISGWRPWRWIPTMQSDTVSVPYGPMPMNYLPAKQIWIDAEVANCDLIPPWNTLNDAWEEFIRWASQGNMISTIGGLFAAYEVMQDDVPGSWGLGSKYQPAQLGYCVGTYFKEQVYLQMYAAKLPFYQFLSEVKEDIIHRSVFKRIYLHNGDVTIITQHTVKDQYIIDTGLDMPVPYDVTIPTGTTIEFFHEQKSIGKYDVKGLTDKFNLIIEKPASATTVPIEGDFYLLNTVLCVQDPYLLDGFWYGTESEDVTSGGTSSSSSAPPGVTITGNGKVQQVP